MAMRDSDALITDGDLSIRRIRGEEEELRQIYSWRLEPHVRATWDNDDDEGGISFEDIRRDYGPRAAPGDPTVAGFIELDSRPIGYIQFYPWKAFADEAKEMSVPSEGESFGLDVFIGDPEALSKGYGSRAVDMLCRYLFDRLRATSVALLTEVTNEQAQRAYEKAGFRRVRRALDLDTRGGERIPCWLMVRDA